MIGEKANAFVTKFISYLLFNISFSYSRPSLFVYIQYNFIYTGLAVLEDLVAKVWQLIL